MSRNKLIFFAPFIIPSFYYYRFFFFKFNFSLIHLIDYIAAGMMRDLLENTYTELLRVLKGHSEFLFVDEKLKESLVDIEIKNSRPTDSPYKVLICPKLLFITSFYLKNYITDYLFSLYSVDLESEKRECQYFQIIFFQ